MRLNLSQTLKPAFLASALLMTGVPAAAYAQDEGVKVEETSTTETKTEQTEKKEVCKTEEDKKAVYEMDFEELMEKHSGDYAKAWEAYEFYQLRRIKLDTAVTEDSVNKLITEIEVLDGLRSDKPITLVIDSPGGSVYDGLRLYNAMKTSKSHIHTVVNGMAASMGAIILIAGDSREATPESRVLIHQVSAGTGGKTYDMEQDLNHINTLQDDLYEIIAENTGLSMQDVRRISMSDVFYDAEESLRLGFIDKLTDTKPGRDIKAGSRDVPEHLYPENRVRDYYLKRSGPNK